MNNYTERVLSDLKKKNPNEPEFIQAATEILQSLASYVDKHPEFEKAALLERFCEAERVIMFRVPWVTDAGEVKVNRGYRVQWNGAIGPYKGGIRFSPTVNLSIMKFLAMEQTLKNSLTTTPIGGGKGGADFDPKGRSDNEIMRFCQSFVTELYRHIGPDTDVPAGDFGVGAREVGFMYGQYKRIVNAHTGTFTGRDMSYGGSLVRKQATGYGLLYITEELLKSKNDSIKGKSVIVSGSGNVGVYAAEKAVQLGAKVVAMNDVSGTVHDPKGIDIQLVKQIKETERLPLSEYAARREGVVFTESPEALWRIKCDAAFPCATQNELDEKSAATLVKNGCKLVAEGANMPTTLEATELLLKHKVLFLPGKAANAGGVSTSSLEMSQSSGRLYWSFEEVDAKLCGIMKNIFEAISAAAAETGDPDNFVVGANIAGFKKVAQAMLFQGVV